MSVSENPITAWAERATTTGQANAKSCRNGLMLPLGVMSAAP